MVDSDTERSLHLARQKEEMTAAPWTRVVTRSMVTMTMLCRSMVLVMRVWQPSVWSSAPLASGLHTPEVVTSQQLCGSRSLWPRPH